MSNQQPGGAVDWFVLAAALFFPLGYSLTQSIETEIEYLAALAGVLAAGWGVAEVRHNAEGGDRLVRDADQAMRLWRVTRVE